MVSGFTDNQPVHGGNRQFADNWELSAQRALTVTRALIAEGVPADSVFAAAFGAQQPVGRTPRSRAGGQPAGGNRTGTRAVDSHQACALTPPAPGRSSRRGASSRPIAWTRSASASSTRWNGVPPVMTARRGACSISACPVCLSAMPRIWLPPTSARKIRSMAAPGRAHWRAARPHREQASMRAGDAGAFDVGAERSYSRIHGRARRGAEVVVRGTLPEPVAAVAGGGADRCRPAQCRRAGASITGA